MQIRRNLIDRWNRRRLRKGTRWIRRRIRHREAIRGCQIVKFVGLLGNAVETLRLKHLVLAEAIVKNSPSDTQNGLGRGSIRVADTPGNGDARSPVVVVANVRLRLETKSCAQSNVGANAVVVLKIEAGIEQPDTRLRNSLGNAELARTASRCDNLGGSFQILKPLFFDCVSRERREIERAVVSRSGCIRIVRLANPAAKFEKVLSVNPGSVILQFVVILGVEVIADAVTTAGEGTG